MFQRNAAVASTLHGFTLTHQYSFHTQGVRALALRSGGGELVSAGGDGRLVAWDVAGGGGLGRATASMRVSRVECRKLLLLGIIIEVTIPSKPMVHTQNTNISHQTCTN